MKRLLIAALVVSLLLSGCVGASAPAEPKQYTATFLTLFDTVTSIVGSADSKEAFQAKVQPVHDELLTYHQLFDIYHDYPGIHNLKTVNDHAGIAPVKVDPQIIAFLKDCKRYYSLTDGRVNVAMGSVLHLWHEARTAGRDDPANAKLPDSAALSFASAHTDIDGLIIDEVASTVYLSDPNMRLDVGAVAKGWAVQQVASKAPAGLLISVGGNVCATGPKEPSGAQWVVAVQDPEGSGDDYLHTLYIHSDSVVTSGDYQRVYWVDGKPYHHIIDPDTLFPASYWRSVTVVCPDSGLADVLSTALFLLPLEQGKALLERCGAEAMWVDAQGDLFYTPGFEAMIRT